MKFEFDNSPFAVFVVWFSALSIISKLLPEPNCVNKMNNMQNKQT